MKKETWIFHSKTFSSQGNRIKIIKGTDVDFYCILLF